MPRKVYVVGSGDVESYRIEGIYDNEKEALKHRNTLAQAEFDSSYAEQDEMFPKGFELKVGRNGDMIIVETGRAFAFQFFNVMEYEIKSKFEETVETIS